MDRNFAGNNLGHRDTIERAYAGENLVEADRPRAALDELENIVASAVSSAEVILCGLESLADRLFGARAEPAGKSGVENSIRAARSADCTSSPRDCTTASTGSTP